MVGIHFERPVGPYADTKELEFISALHQTCQPFELRQNGTIEAKDIMYFLRSRHGIHVTQDVIRQSIIQELCGSPEFKNSPQNTNMVKDNNPATMVQKEKKGSLDLDDTLLDGDDYDSEDCDDSDDDDNGGGEEEPKEPIMDICQMLTVLLIPYLRNGNPSDGKYPKEVGQVVAMAFDTIQAELRTHSMDKSTHHKTENDTEKVGATTHNTDGILMTVDLLRDCFNLLGEYQISKETLQEMIAIGTQWDSTGTGTTTSPTQFLLTKQSFLHVLTSDIQQWNPTMDESQRTHYEDAAATAQAVVASTVSPSKKEEEEDSAHGIRVDPNQTVVATTTNGTSGTTTTTTKDQDTTSPHNMESFWLASHVDNTADNYRNMTWFALSWVTAVFVYLCYFTNTNIKFSKEHFENLGCIDNFGCDIALALTNWSIIFIELMILGFVWIMTVNMGNSNQCTESISSKIAVTCRISCGMVLVVGATQLTFLYEFNWGWVNTYKGDEYIGSYYITWIMGWPLLGCQLIRIIGMFLTIGNITQGNTARFESYTKQAATYKIQRLMDHATILHGSQIEDDGNSGKNKKSTVVKSVKEESKKLHPATSSNSTGEKTTSTVLFNYNIMQDIKEDAGGIAWTFQGIWNGTLLKEEGIFLFGRLLAVNMVQFLVVGILIGGFFIALFYLNDFLLPQSDDCDYRINGILVDTSTNKFIESAENDLESEVGNIRFLFETQQQQQQQQDIVFRYLQDGSTIGGSVNDTDDMVVGDLWHDLNGTKDGSIAGEGNRSDTDDISVTDVWNDLNSTKDGIENVWTNRSLPEFLDGFANYVHEHAGELAGYFNWTSHNWNINATHFYDGYHLFEGQFPAFNETSDDDVEFPTYCYDSYITNGTYIWDNEALQHDEFLEDAEIEPWMYRLSASMGLLVALIASMGITLVYIPSYVSTVLKFRSGYIPSLRGDNAIHFLSLRNNPDQTSILWGSALWGILYTSGLVFLLFTALTFLCAWTITRPYIRGIVSNLIGIFSTVAIRMMVMIFQRSRIFAPGGYYRQRPASANMTNVILESWSLGTSIGTVTTRAIKLIFITLFYIGRIDTPLLAPGVGYVKGIPMDPAPIAFRKDLLIHEAHRHPYMERLGLLYMLKLYHGKSFGTRAGATWRLLFTLALLPWMRNYRVTQRAPTSLPQEDIKAGGGRDGTNEAKDEDDDKKTVSPPPMMIEIEKNWDSTENVQSLLTKRRALKQQLIELNHRITEKKMIQAKEQQRNKKKK